MFMRLSQIWNSRHNDSINYQTIRCFQWLSANATVFSVFHLNAFSAASSLLPLDEARHREWIGGELLQQQAEVLVPTTRLDSFLAASGVSHVDYLKIDAQVDFLVVQSAGKRLGDIRKIKLEVTITPTQLYVGGAFKEEFIKYLTGTDLC